MKAEALLEYLQFLYKTAIFQIQYSKYIKSQK